MKYPVHDMEEVEVGPDGKYWVGFRVQWLVRPLMLCWARESYYWNGFFGYTAENPCERTGDFRGTIGLCPKHYEEIIGEDPHLD